MGWTLVLAVRLSSYRLELDGVARGLLARPGSVVVLPRRRHHRITVADARSSVRATWVHMHCPQPDGTDLFDHWRLPLVLQDVAVIQLLDRIIASGAEPGLRACCAQQEALYGLLAALLGHGRELPRHKRLTDIEPVLRHMRAHLDQAVDRDSLAAVVGLSATRFHDVFVEVMGIAPMRYLRLLRIDHAKHELLRSTDSIAEIGARCGYPDPYHFSRVFRSIERLSPSAWRARMQRLA